MRLTLRTLLAYMDEILEPADREELAKKVESSEFAHDLIHRTKDTTRRLRLSAPQVVGTGIGLDPNTVAEYLDNVLPPDNVADFERICLESDVHLAEVASAHHVLTMVLGEPAEVDSAARQRMYSLPTEIENRKQLRIEPAHEAPIAVFDSAAVAAPRSVLSPTSSAPAEHEAIPDYLRASAWSRYSPLLITCAALLLIAVTVLLISGMRGWFAKETQLASGLRPRASSDLSVSANPPLETALATHAADDANEPVGSESLTNESGANGTTDTTLAPSMSAAPPRLLVPSMGGSAPAAVLQEPNALLESPPEVIGVDESAYGYGGEPTESDDRYAIEIPESTAPDANIPDANAPAANVAPLPPQLASATPVRPEEQNLALPDSVTTENAAADVATVEDAISASETGRPTVEAITLDPEAAAGQSPEQPIGLGTYLDGKNVLLRFDPQAAAWFRVAPRATFQAGDKLLALPAFYPKLTLASGLHLKLAGGTMITLGPAVPGSDEPSIDVAYGKLVVTNTANNESGIQLTIGDSQAGVRLGRNATFAVDVSRKYEPGLDPRTTQPSVAAELYARDGSVTWSDSSGSKDIATPGHWSISDGMSSAVSEEVKFPEWIDHEPIEQRSEQLFGAPMVESSLDPARPVEEQMLELYQSSRRREVKSLVARSSVYAGLFVPFIEALRDSDQKAAWKTHIDTLRTAMALGPDSANKIYHTLVDQRGQEAANDLYQMLCGYSAEQIGSPANFQAGLAGRLIDWMESDSLDYRVLAVQDMTEITGMRLMPNPAGTPVERARGVRLWRQRLKAGDVEPLTEP